MKYPLHLAVICLLVLSCHTKNEPAPAQPEIPDALQAEGKSYGYFKRSPDDVVQRLYAEQVEDSEELKVLEERISKLGKQKLDSLSFFTKYNDPNEEYYEAAAGYLGSIKDSVLKVKMDALVKQSLSRYNSRKEAHEKLLGEIATRDLTIADLHLALKLTTTLPVIEKFQADHLPPLLSLQGHRRNQENAIQKIENILMKNGM